MRLLWDPKLLLLLNVIGSALAVAVVVCALQVDGIVNVTLYDYGLIFDYEWATPYWTFLRLLLGIVGGIAGVNTLTAILWVLHLRRVPTSVQVKTVSHDRVKPVDPRLSLSKQIQKNAPQGEEDGVEVMSLPMVCRKCGKVFTQPLCMFDFKSGKPRLVNVCPYCNTILAVAGNSTEK
jgi:uncharacterized Zn-finger protein